MSNAFTDKVGSLGVNLTNKSSYLCFSSLRTIPAVIIFVNCSVACNQHDYSKTLERWFLEIVDTFLMVQKHYMDL